LNIFVKASHGSNQLTSRQILTHPVLCLAFGFGSGLVKKAPGTMGTLAAIPIYLILVQLPFWGYSLFTIIAGLVGIWICQIAADQLNEHDYGGIVWDEIVGYLITLWLVPFSWSMVIWGFILFRIFDIVKPWPIKWVDQRVKGGLGIMLDDVLAGLFSALILILI